MKKARSLENSKFLTLQSTGDERIELPPKVLETPIIPFDQSPIQLSLNSSDLLSIPYGVRNVKKKIKKNFILKNFVTVHSRVNHIVVLPGSACYNDVS